MANRAFSGASDIENEDEADMRKGPWTVEEDMQVMRYIRLHGEGRWNFLAKAAGLKRNGRSCRLRWVNSLRPDLKRSKITLEEERLIIELHGRWGNRWSHIARSLPGRTDNEIKNYWRTKIKGKLNLQDKCSSTGVDVDNQIRYEGPLLSDCLATSSPRPTDHDSAEPSTRFPTQSTGEVEVQIDKTQYLQHNISSQVIPIHEVNDEYVLQGGTRLVPSPTDDDGHPGAASQPDFEDSENQVFENSLRYNLSAGSLSGMLYFSEFCADGADQGDRTPPSCYTVASPEAFSDSEAYFNRYSDVLWNMDEDSGTRIGRRSY